MHILKHCCFLLKTELRMSATGLLDPEESTKPTKSDLASEGDDQCCTCPKTPEVKDREKDERVGFKMFENFLHNAIFLPRYIDLLTVTSAGLANRLLCGVLRVPPGLRPFFLKCLCT